MPAQRLLDALGPALPTDDLTVIEDLLAERVEWHGTAPGGGCRSREDVVRTLRGLRDEGIRPRLRAALRLEDRVLLEVGMPDAQTVWFTLATDADGLIAEMLEYSSEAGAEHDAAVRAAAAEGRAVPPSAVDALVPFAHVADVERSIAFYGRLGFTVRDTFAPDGRPVWAFLRSGEAELMVAAADAPVDHHVQGILFYVYAPDLAALRDHLVAGGVTPGEIVDGSPGPELQMRVTDPDGYCLMVAQA